MFEDDNLDDLDIGLEDLPSSRMGRTSEEDSCTWFLQALPVRDPVFMK